MKKSIWLVCLMLVLLPMGAGAEAAPSSEQFDPELAQTALQIAEMCYLPSMQASVLSVSGYRQVGLYNMDREPDDSRHVAAYALYDRVTEDERTEVIIAIRGTGEGEWKLNLDLMPSGNYDLPYAENFALAAEDILSTHQAYLDTLVSPVFLITGHSRGAAVANILGARLTDRFQAENVFVYTFATPRTVRGEYPAYSNIFNVINPADLVTYLPFPQWGFQRYGIDVELPAEDAALLPMAQAAYAQRTDQTGPFVSSLGRTVETQKIILAMANLAPDVETGFQLRHALSHPGEATTDEPGMTADAFMLMLLSGGMTMNQAPSADVSSIMQTQNDFTPLLSVSLFSDADESTTWIASMHMPATYGAWMSALQ